MIVVLGVGSVVIFAAVLTSFVALDQIDLLGLTLAKDLAALVICFFAMGYLFFRIKASGLYALIFFGFLVLMVSYDQILGSDMRRYLS